jgi:endopeptidase Clp ATP-binding regulatory subunit ClpX
MDNDLFNNDDNQQDLFEQELFSNSEDKKNIEIKQNDEVCELTEEIKHSDDLSDDKLDIEISITNQVPSEELVEVESISIEEESAKGDNVSEQVSIDEDSDEDDNTCDLIDSEQIIIDEDSGEESDASETKGTLAIIEEFFADGVEEAEEGYNSENEEDSVEEDKIEVSIEVVENGSELDEDLDETDLSEKIPPEIGDIQKQIQDALEGIGGNSFVIPIPPKKVRRKRKKKVKEKKNKEDLFKNIKEFELKPKEIKTYLDRFVIKQEEAKKVLAVAICDHYNHIRELLNKKIEDNFNYIKQNVLLLGPTGVGKTYLIKSLANLIGVPFVKADATKFTATGYVGHDVEDLVRDLVKLADGNVELAEYGIIYIDEIDKIANKPSDGGRDVSSRGVQINLLKLMEESEVTVQSQMDMVAQIELAMGGEGKKKRTINTKNILFIVSGAFDKLSETIEKRVYGNQIGFGKQKDKDDKNNLLHLASTEDFIKFGFEPEFIGRLPIRVACNELLPDDLLEILKVSEGSILRQYIKDFEGYGIKLDLTDDALKLIAEKAYEQKTGARGLMTVLERLFRDFKYELPSTDIKELQITDEVVNSPSEALKEMLEVL